MSLATRSSICGSFVRVPNCCFESKRGKLLSSLNTQGILGIEISPFHFPLCRDTGQYSFNFFILYPLLCFSVVHSFPMGCVSRIIGRALIAAFLISFPKPTLLVFWRRSPSGIVAPWRSVGSRRRRGIDEALVGELCFNTVPAGRAADRH